MPANGRKKTHRGREISFMLGLWEADILQELIASARQLIQESRQYLDEFRRQMDEFENRQAEFDKGRLDTDATVRKCNARAGAALKRFFTAAGGGLI